jgi:hypothetical protein
MHNVHNVHNRYAAAVSLFALCMVCAVWRWTIHRRRGNTQGQTVWWGATVFAHVRCNRYTFSYSDCRHSAENNCADVSRLAND